MLPSRLSRGYTAIVFLRELHQSVSCLRGAGTSVTSRLGRLGIETIADLLQHYPRDYEDRSRYIPFSRFAEHGHVHTVAEVISHEWFGFGRMKTLKILVRDDSSEAILVCFNRPFLEKTLPVGARVLIYGKFQFKFGEIQSTAFDAEKLPENSSAPRGLVPLYPLTEGLAQGTVRKLMREALEMYGSRIEDEIDPEIIAKRGLIPKSKALLGIHFPSSQAEKEDARKTLAYGELFVFQLGIALRMWARKSQKIARPSSPGILHGRLLERLPFTLTSEQNKVLKEILLDMDAPHPMARLLQGDVGSGKTVVALLAALHCVERGGQAAMMAPTELLARQHAATAAKLVEPLGIRLAFLSGNVDDSARPHILSALKKGEIDIVIGTHALFSADVAYKSLSFVVIDEQHRFGVMQRLALYKKGDIPDTLMMTATPIPRSLALTLFGDLAVSTIAGLPPGRKPVKTHLAKEGNEIKVYEFVREIVKAGRQAFFVYPLIGESDRGSLKDAQTMAERLAAKVYPEFKISLLHSRLKEDKKRAIMDDFVAGNTNILVATSVVEVGVDVPNAAAMVVEHAERFGLSALHQLRGRIGRGQDQAYCFLIYSDSVTEDAAQRLKALYGTSDGFVLAEEDLKIRGPGELLGTAQSGSLRLRIADPLKDFGLLKEARSDSFGIVESDPGFLNPEHVAYRRFREESDA